MKDLLFQPRFLPTLQDFYVSTYDKDFAFIFRPSDDNNSERVFIAVLDQSTWRKFLDNKGKGYESFDEAAAALESALKSSKQKVEHI